MGEGREGMGQLEQPKIASSCELSRLAMLRAPRPRSSRGGCARWTKLCQASAERKELELVMSEQKNLAVGDMSEHVASAGAAACDPVVGLIVKDESGVASAAASVREYATGERVVECKESVALPLSLSTPPSSREPPPRRAGPRARQECGDVRHRPRELDAPVSWKACRARVAALASGVKGLRSRKGLVGGLRGRKGLVGGLTPRRVRVKSPLWKGKKPAHFASAWNNQKKRRRRSERGRPHSKRGRPPSARMTKWTHPYPPLPRFRGVDEQLSYSCSVWPPPKLVQVAVTACYDGGGLHRARYQAEPATACCC
ncbi:hypothetical protein GWK47_034741 [Chionoecetes opilio]|uniref:Uncharacterized protein n=1 Tax=Chionoecetes opilio TaxID=41210 RepID=A0A8J4YUP5_CHIOP|nr:hypothetical protein GWK47_034741 [Chionoecetes opilio]